MKLRSLIITLRLLALVLLLSAAGFIIGSDRRANPALRAGDVQSPASTQPTVIGPVAEHAIIAEGAKKIEPTVNANGSTLVINHQLQSFGPAMLRLNQSNGMIVARLYSNDPRGVLTGDEIANTYDFEMRLPEIKEGAEIGGAIWSFKSPSNSRQDTPYGIFLHKQQRILQPMDVQITFSGQAPLVTVSIAGEFWMYRAGAEFPAPPEMVRVSGILSATVPSK